MIDKSSLERELSKGLIQWYRFRKGARALFIAGGQECFEVLPEAMAEWGMEVESVSLTSFFHVSSEDPSQVPLEVPSKNSSQAQNNSIPTGPYDYIVLAGAIERSKAPEAFLKNLRSLLASHGVLLAGADNRLGIRYFCGDRDPFTEKNFDGIENYRHLGEAEMKKLAGRGYARAELTRMLEEAGFEHHRFYSVMPDWTRPQFLCGEDCKPQRKWNEMLIPQYHNPDTVFLEEEWLYDTLTENGLFHSMSNGYLIECPLDGSFADADQVTVSIESGKAEALAAILRKDQTIEKRALYREGLGKIERMVQYAADLKAHGIQVMEIKREKDGLVTPCMPAAAIPGIQGNDLREKVLGKESLRGKALRKDALGEEALDFFRRLLCEDRERFLRELERFLKLIERSSEPADDEEVDWEHFDPDWNRRRKDDPGREKWRRIALGIEGKREELGVILRKGYMDLIPSNCIYVKETFGEQESCIPLSTVNTVEGEKRIVQEQTAAENRGEAAAGAFVFYNQEHCLDMLPVYAIWIRTIDSLYRGPVWEKALIPKEELLERYHLKEHERLWRLYAGRFTETIHGEKELLEYNRIRRRDWTIVNANRYRMNYSEKEYERIFKDIFKGADGRQLYLFGSGVFAEKFLEQFGKDYEVAGILDNNPDRRGTKLADISILSPDVLKTLPQDSYKVIICIKNCVPVMRQLKEKLGVTNYSVYDWHQEYPRKLPAAAAEIVGPGEGRGPKKYHIGYIAGVFDLFHIGHLNLFKRAKEQCDYLIVGVVSDESVMENKKTMPYMPFEERMELVRSCRYVDEAVALPTYNGDTDEAYRRYQFDVQFSGSDYADDPIWLAKKAYLEKRGAELVFFPYTKSTSSTKRKEQIYSNGG